MVGPLKSVRSGVNRINITINISRYNFWDSKTASPRNQVNPFVTSFPILIHAHSPPSLGLYFTSLPSQWNILSISDVFKEELLFTLQFGRLLDRCQRSGVFD